MKELSLEQKVQRSLDIQEVQNVASMHEYYHAALMHKEEYENIWSKTRDDISWTNNNQRMPNRKAFHKFYVEDIVNGKKMWLEALHKTRPDIAVKPENYAAGILWSHTLTTPVIQIAGDGKTAKGIWMSWGHVTNPTDEGFMSTWAYEKYGMDFVKEDGEWKIWHLHTFVDFYSPVNGSWTNPATNMAANKDKKEQKEFPKDPMYEYGEYYTGYSPSTVPVMEPKPPVPYYTFSETFSY
jgi:hypothetical protein